MRIVKANDHHFGKDHPVDHPSGEIVPTTLRLSVAVDGSVVWIVDRKSVPLQLEREEAIELMGLLQKLYPLDSLGQV
ncbi:MAG: hypothetical protein AB7V39_17175 [Nitrospiraceae bacterium]